MKNFICIFGLILCSVAFASASDSDDEGPSDLKRLFTRKKTKKPPVLRSSHPSFADDEEDSPESPENSWDGGKDQGDIFVTPTFLQNNDLNLSPKSLATKVFWDRENEKRLVLAEKPRPPFQATLDLLGNCTVENPDGTRVFVRREQIEVYLCSVISVQGDLWFVDYHPKKRQDSFDHIEKQLHEAHKTLAWFDAMFPPIPPKASKPPLVRRRKSNDLFELGPDEFLGIPSGISWPSITEVPEDDEEEVDDEREGV